uniref:CCHC-type domain-containing protein n=1 Tax=Amphimedon queenslandica TaxID=400682 RepID=A0A1X7UTU3_AMPQE
MSLLRPSRRNEKQFRFNEEVTEKVEDCEKELASIEVPADAAEVNVPVRVLEKAKEAIKESKKIIYDRQKLIKIADRSEFGWGVVHEYQSDELAENSEDEKKLSKAEKAADQKAQKKKKAAAGKVNKVPFQQAPRMAEWWRSRSVWSQSPPYASNSFNRSASASTSGPRQVIGPCFACGELGHLRSSCPKTASGAPAAAKYPFIREDERSVELSGEYSSESQGEVLGSRYWEYDSSAINVKGRIKSCSEFWVDTLQCSQFVSEIVAQGYMLPFVSLPEPRMFLNQKSVLTESGFVKKAVANLHRDGCVRRVMEQPRVCSPLLVVTSRSGKQRLVINLRYINKFLWKDKFKYEDMHTALAYFEVGHFVNTFDLKSGYHHIDIYRDFQQYLGFQWEGEYFPFTVLPFGLSTACYVFTKVLRPLVKYWRSNGIKALLYIDDGIIISPDMTAAISNIQFVRQPVAAAGLVINEEKSCWASSQVGVWLGFNIDLALGELAVPEDKIQQLTGLLIAAQSQDTI